MPDPPPAPTAPDVTMFLVGDAGEATTGRGAVMDAIRTEAGKRPEQGRVAVVFLGDNVYEKGIRADAVEEDTEKLQGQVSAVPPLPNSSGIFVPGNHDWAKGAPDRDGARALELQRDALVRLAADSGRAVRLVPADGCPGPVADTLSDHVLLVAIDTEWLLRQPSGHACGGEGFYGRLETVLEDNRDRFVVLAAHHPIVSGGPHGAGLAAGSALSWPIRVLRKTGPLEQDLPSPSYRRMIADLRGAIRDSGHRRVIYAAGHDHSVQVIELDAAEGPAWQLISGSASKSTPVREVDGMRYATSRPGMIALDFRGDEAWMSVFVPDAGREGSDLQPVYRCVIAGGAGSSGCPVAAVNDEGGAR